LRVLVEDPERVKSYIQDPQVKYAACNSIPLTGQIAGKKSRKQYFREHTAMERYFLSLKMERIWQKD
jgi:hypothetical protein